MREVAQVICIRLDAQQSHLILVALAEQPFKLVFELIGRLNKWVNEIFEFDSRTTMPTSEQNISFEFTLPELVLTVKALGDMPFQRVHRLVQHLTQEMHEQMRISHDDLSLKEHGESGK
jgi:hypothetical protein